MTRNSDTNDLHIDLLAIARKFYGKTIESLNLLPSQIEKQSLNELYESLKRIDEVSKKEEEYGILKIKMTPTAGCRCII